MSFDVSLQTDPGVLSDDPMKEARRQVEICNACRYCEGFCAVFPAITRDKVFTDGDLTQFANLCHNCRGCHYACQYTEPHDFALNLPRALADVRVDSWERLAWPGGLARLFQSHGGALVAALVAGFAVMFAVVALLPGGGEGFYAWLSHGAMVAIFAPAFLLPLVALALSLRAYWREVGGTRPTLADWRAALVDAARMKNLDGGQGQGCNFEKGERYSDARRHVHQAVMWGFLICFAATSVATLMHYAGWPAPYAWYTPPKLLGLPGGLLLVVGCVGMLVLKAKANPELGATGRSSGETAFIALLGFVGLSGLVLYALRDTGMGPALLALHLGSVLTFFLLTPYTKMAHGFYRLAALLREAQDRRLRG